MIFQTIAISTKPQGEVSAMFPPEEIVQVEHLGIQIQTMKMHKEIDEKNRIIEDYQRKIDLLEKMLAAPHQNKV